RPRRRRAGERSVGGGHALRRRRALLSARPAREASLHRPRPRGRGSDRAARAGGARPELGRSGAGLGFAPPRPPQAPGRTRRLRAGARARRTLDPARARAASDARPEAARDPRVLAGLRARLPPDTRQRLVHRPHRGAPAPGRDHGRAPRGARRRARGRPRPAYRPAPAGSARPRLRRLEGALMPGSTATGALRRAVERYRSAPLGARLFVRGRAFLAELAVVERYVPKKGFVVDLGCGHGLFACVLREASPTRRVLGIDLDPRKIEVAR